MASIRKRKNSNGEITYTVQVRLKGFPNEVATFSRLTDAKKWAQSIEVSMRENRHFKQSESKKHTVSDLINRYLDRLERNNPKRIKDVKPILAWWDEQIGKYLLANVNRSLLSQQVEKLAERTVKRFDKDLGKPRQIPIGPARINRYISAFSHVCTVAVNEWEWLEDNPIRKISKMKEPRGRVRFLDEKERQSLLLACSVSFYAPLHLIVVLALSTGARKSEILWLRWSQINFEKSQIVLHETKNGERRVIPIRGLALQLLYQHKKVRRIDTDLLFPSRKGDKPYEIKKPWEKAIKQAQIEDFRFHDLRHSAASYLAMNGASLAEIAEVLGHKTHSMVKRYAHLSEAHTSNVVASMNERIFGNV